MQQRQRGFTLVEVLIGATISFVVIWGLVVLADRYAASAARLNARLGAQASADRLVERLSSEAASAWAVFRPATDVLGDDDTDGHEIDFFAEDGSHRPYAWAYRYDAETKAVTRYAYAPGVAPVAGEVVGTFDAFIVSAPIDVTELSNPLSAAYDPLFSGAHATPQLHPYSEMPRAQGGNALVAVHVVASGVDRTELLASGTAPTAFTIVVHYTPSPAPTQPPISPLPTMTAQ